MVTEERVEAAYSEAGKPLTRRFGSVQEAAAFEEAGLESGRFANCEIYDHVNKIIYAEEWRVFRPKDSVDGSPGNFESYTGQLLDGYRFSVIETFDSLV